MFLFILLKACLDGLNKFIFKQWLTGSHGKIIPIDGQFKEGLRTCSFFLSKMSTGHGITWSKTTKKEKK